MLEIVPDNILYKTQFFFHNPSNNFRTESFVLNKQQFSKRDTMSITETHPPLKQFQAQAWQYYLTSTTVNPLHSLHVVQGAIVASCLEVLGLSLMLTTTLMSALTNNLRALCS